MHGIGLRGVKEFVNNKEGEIEIFEETDRSKKHGKLYIVVPCYNEEEALETSAHSLIKKLEDLTTKGLISEESRIVFVDDGSKDKTWQIIQSLFQKEEKVIGLRFAHNRGHQNAILAGMMYARKYCDFVITIDADLQQDIEALDRFIKAMRLYLAFVIPGIQILCLKSQQLRFSIN